MFRPEVIGESFKEKGHQRSASTFTRFRHVPDIRTRHHTSTSVPANDLRENDGDDSHTATDDHKILVSVGVG